MTSKGYPPKAFPQITYQYAIDGSKRVPSTRRRNCDRTQLIHRLRQELAQAQPQQESSNPFLTVPPANGIPTIEFPILDPSELAPIAAEITVRNQEDFLLDEIHFTYGASRHAAATFTLRFAEDDQPPQMLFDAYGSNERIVSPLSDEYIIRMGELQNLLHKCRNNPSCFMGHVFEAIEPGRGTVESSVREKHDSILTDTITTLATLDKPMDRPFDR